MTSLRRIPPLASLGGSAKARAVNDGREENLNKRLKMQKNK